jgi:molybdate transport system permease protein
VLTPEDLNAIWVTTQLAATTTLLLMLFAPGLAWWLATSRSRWRALVESLVAMPLILPPTVLGFYLLLAYAPQHPPGSWWLALTGETLAFHFSGLVIASIIYSLPFVVQPLQAAFQGVDPRLLQAAESLGAGRIDRFFSIVVPLTRNSFIAAACLGFTHTVGEFGVILMIGGNIPGETAVLSIALYDHVEALRYDQAHALAAGLVIFSLSALLVINGARRRPPT